MIPEKLETQIAEATEAGREALAVWRKIMKEMPGEMKVAKSFELTEMTRQIMRAGIRSSHPNASDDEIQTLYVDRLLNFAGTSLAEVKQQQREQS